MHYDLPLDQLRAYKPPLDTIVEPGFDAFWEDSDYARQNYVGRPVTPEMIDHVENRYGYTLPRAYVELLRNQNGGIPTREACPTREPTTWSEDHCAITGIFGSSFPGDGSLGLTFTPDRFRKPVVPEKCRGGALPRAVQLPLGPGPCGQPPIGAVHAATKIRGRREARRRACIAPRAYSRR